MCLRDRRRLNLGEIVNGDRLGEIRVENLLFSHIIALLDNLALSLTDLSPIVESPKCEFRSCFEERVVSGSGYLNHGKVGGLFLFLSRG